MKVFLGGTCNGSLWRDGLMKQLKVDYFNPVVADWTPECQTREITERENADVVLYVLTPKMTGVYAVAEVVDDSNKRPKKTLLCVLPSDTTETGEEIVFDAIQIKSLAAVKKLVAANGAKVLDTFDEIADYLNSLNSLDSKGGIG